jgi:hypothetical protein
MSKASMGTPSYLSYLENAVAGTGAKIDRVEVAVESKKPSYDGGRGCVGTQQLNGKV